jgi:subtilisin family serine protease
MRIPVIVSLPSQEPLQESAMSARAGLPQGILPQTRIPDMIDVDATFSAVPIGTGETGAQTLESVAPQASPRFAIRGFVEVESAEAVPEKIGDADVFADPKIAHFLTCGGDPAVGAAVDVATKLNVAALANAGLDGKGVAVAVVDTGINLQHLRSRLGVMPQFDPANSWMPRGVVGTPGQLAVDHGSMCAFDVLIAAPKATLLDFPVLLGSAPGGAQMGSFLSVAITGFAQLIAFWAVAFAPGGANKYKALVINNSWGMFHPSWDFPAGHQGRYSDNPNHPFNRLVNVLAGANADILFAAGNCGSNCPDSRCQNVVSKTIVGANATADVLTLAGCDINDQRVGYSSQGPAIPGMVAKKPDLTAYTHFRGSDAFGVGEPDSGTSAACPVASGCVAALRTQVSPITTPPAALFAQLNLTARQVGGTGWNVDFGHGIIDPVAAGQSLGVIGAV